MKYDELGIPQMSLWKKIKWNLFGETKILYWWIGGVILINLIFWGILGFVGFHFIAKFW